MHSNNVVYVLLVVGWLCSVGESGILQSRVIDENKNIRLKEDAAALDCSQFTDDADIIRQLPFPVAIDSTDDNFGRSQVFLKPNTSFVRNFYLYKEKIVPQSIYCLSNLETLSIGQTPFPDDTIPDALGNLKELDYFSVYNSRLVKITEQLFTLPKLTILLLNNCSLTSIKNLEKMENLWGLQLPNNQLSHLDGIPAVDLLFLDGNRFTDIPITKNKDKLRHLDMSNNPLKSAASIMSFRNLETIFIENATLTSIPATIDQLSNVEELALTDNKISYLPTNVLNLRHLKYFSIHNNPLSSDDIQGIQQAFNKSHPDLSLYI